MADEFPTIAECTGGSVEEHCCWYTNSEGEKENCQWLERGTNGRNWSCGLRAELGSWERVYEDIRYIESRVVREVVEQYPGYGCGDWPNLIPEITIRIREDEEKSQVRCTGGCAFELMELADGR